MEAKSGEPPEEALYHFKLVPVAARFAIVANGQSVGKDSYKLTGDLTIHGVTKSVTMDLVYRGTVENPMSKKQTSGFQLTGVIKRTDFGVGSKFPSAMVSDEVRIKADGEFVQN